MELLDQIVGFVLGLPLWAQWLAIVLATFASEDLTCIAAGLIAAGGHMEPAHAIGAAAAGIWLGDLLLFWAGRAIGRPALRRAPLVWIVHEEDVEVSAEWFKRRGAVVILATRFVPGSRLPTYVAAGLLGMGGWRFALFTLGAVALWAPLIGGGAMLVGRPVLRWVEVYSDWAWLIVLATIAFLFVVVKFLIPAFTWRGRRFVVSRWRRVTRWEFWPPWIFYPPVFLYVLGLALRRRSLSMLTAVNPALQAGGFIGESKAEILERLALRGRVAPARRLPAALPAAQRLELALAFVREQGLAWPVVLKPDSGQRGSGVVIARGADEVHAYLERIQVDCIVQEYVPGREYGVFYYRHPREERGRIFSVTEKVFPCVTGDGASTLERLILMDPRAVCMARLYLDKNAHRLWQVPARGERVQLVEIGNHCRGTLFLDGARLITPELEEEIDAISRSFEGFYFGRYDVRVPSEQDFRAGRGLRVIELNGATSEATSIYDPGCGLWRAYRTLFEQWRILFEIAAENRRRGAKEVHWSELLRLLARYRAGARSHPV